MDFSIVVYIIIVIIVLYYLISWWSNESTQMVTIQSSTVQTVIPENKGAPAGQVNCAYSIWINVADMTNTGSPRLIFLRSDIEMKLASDNSLLLNVNNSVTLDPYIGTSDNILIPMQKWVNIIISFESNNLVVYIDGKMVASKIVTQWGSIASTTSLGTNNPFSGEIANFKYFNDYLTVQDAWEIYKDGYGSGFFSGLINKYKLKVAFLKDNSEVTSFSF